MAPGLVKACAVSVRLGGGGRTGRREALLSVIALFCEAQTTENRFSKSMNELFSKIGDYELNERLEIELRVAHRKDRKEMGHSGFFRSLLYLLVF